MAIKPCKECTTPISDKAEKCPQCGAKQPRPTSILTWICVGMLCLAAIIWMFSDKTTGEPVELSVEQKELRAKASTMRAISEVLKDSDSAKFEFLNENCGTVNSKNSFGAYVGARRFVSIKDIVDLEGHTISKKEMDSLWKKYCS